MSTWRCKRCGAANDAAWKKCEGCGRAPAKVQAPRVVSAAPLAVMPQYALLTSEDEAKIAQERARIKALFAPIQPQHPGRAGVPPIAPMIREDVARREARATQLSDRVEPPDLAEMDADW